MKKEIWLSIYSHQQFEGFDDEQVALDTAATLYEKRGKYYIIYQESELTGLQGTQTTIKLDGKRVSLIRTGTFPSHMMFYENERHVGLYHTPIGTEMEIATYTSQVVNTVNDSGGKLIIDYTIEMEHAVMGEHHFEMRVLPQ